MKVPQKVMGKRSKNLEIFLVWERFFVTSDEVINTKFFIENLSHYLITIAFYIMARKVFHNQEYFMAIVLYVLAASASFITLQRTNQIINSVISIGMLLRFFSKDNKKISNWKVVLISIIWISIKIGISVCTGLAISTGLRASLL